MDQLTQYSGDREPTVEGTAGQIELCMQGYGYEIVDKHCRNSPLQTTDALCYEPIGWLGKLSLKLETLLGMAQSSA
jgi:hypothetical protein